MIFRILDLRRDTMIKYWCSSNSIEIFSLGKPRPLKNMIEPRFTRGEYWLLENAVECRVAFRFLLGAASEFSEQYNKVGYGLEPDALIGTLQRLQAAGSIRCIRVDNSNSQVPCHQLSRDELAQALDEVAEPWTLYELTPEGGMQWEAFARPKWDYIIREEDHWNDHDPDAEHPDSVTFTCATLKRLKRAVEYYSRGLGKIECDSLKYLEIGSWNATYWKELPSGFSTTAKLFGKPRDCSIIDPIQDLAFLNYCKLRDNWYQWR